MALIQCPECNKDVSDKAATCIHCGNPLIQDTPSAAYATPTQAVPKKKMGAVGKIGSGILIFFIVLAIIGALNSNDNSKPVSPSLPTTPSSSDQSATSNSPDADTSNSDDLKVSNLHVSHSHYGMSSIRGTVTNGSSTKSYGYAQVEINLYDAAGNQLGSTLANVNNLEPGKSWNFEAPITDEHVKSYKVMKVTAF